MKKDTKTQTPAPEIPENFKLTRTKIKEMYKDDESIRRNVNKAGNTSSTIGTLTIDTIKSQFYNLSPELENQRKYSNELYAFYPIYAEIIDYLSNMYLWRYIYVPRLVKDKKSADYAEIYALMGEVVDGLSIETTFPMILTELFINGAVFLVTTKNTSSKTITTIALPNKYCRVNAMTQFGTYTYQFDFSYFDSLGLSTTEMEQIFNYYPKEMVAMYNQYLGDKQNLRWQQLDPKYAAAILLNKYGFPTKLRSIFGLFQFDDYMDNELERNAQQLDKIISHKMPTWEDKLIVGIEEMTELHQSMAKVLTKNKHIRLLTSFGEMDVLSIGEDKSKENKTLTNAYNAIYDNLGENNALFSGDSVQALKYGLLRDANIVWKYVEQLVNFYNLTINNSFNFKGYQCDLSILPITVYNEEEKLLTYKEAATLGVGKLEYIVSSGTKQINIGSKIELEDFLKLDKMKPLSTSYTQNDNSKSVTSKEDDNTDTEDENNDGKQDKIKEQEVNEDDETDTN